MASQLRRGDAIPVPASGAVQRRRQPQPGPLLAHPAKANTTVENTAIPMAVAQQIWGAPS